MNLILACFCFDDEVFNGEKIAGLIRETVNFHTPHIITDDFLKSGGKFDSGVHIQKIEKSQSIHSVRLGNANYEGSFFDVGPVSWGFQTVSWCCTVDELPDLNYFNEIAAIAGFNAGYISDSEDVLWQSETEISNYELFGKSHTNLPKIFDEDFGEQKVDTLQNPGARHLFPGMWLQAAWRMWFGQGAFKHIPRERLLTFPRAKIVKSLDGGAIFIELYPDPLSYGDDVSRKSQKDFEEWIGMNVLVKQARNLASLSVDPCFEIEEGQFPHGGNRLMTVWLDENDKPIAKSKATSGLAQEMNEKSNIVWEKKL